MITGLQQLLEEAELDEFYDAVLDRTGYLRALEERTWTRTFPGLKTSMS